MKLYPFNPGLGQKMQTDAPDVHVDAAYAAHIHIPAASAPAASSTGIHAAMNLGAATQTITTGFSDPAVARNARIIGNVSGITGVVTLYGKNSAGEAISEALTANGVTAVDGAKAFAEFTSAALPAQNHAPVAQVETATVTGTISTAGNATVVVTAAGMTGSPKTISVAVALSDNASAIAGKIRTALAADTAVAAMFDVSGTTTAVVLTRKTPAANDSTLNISIDNGTCAGIATAATSANTTAGVPYDTISVGWGDKLGIPYKLAHNTVIPGMTFKGNTREGTEPTVAVSATSLESNTVDLNSALDGSVVDIYLMV